MNKNIFITIILIILIGAGAFFAGMQYQKSQAASTYNGQFAQGTTMQTGLYQGGQSQAGRSGGGRGRFGGTTIGNVVSQDTNSITVQLPDGSSKIINISGSTTFFKTDTASKSGVQNGMRIVAFGTTNSDGSVTAQNIMLNPQMSMRGGNRGGQ